MCIFMDFNKINMNFNTNSHILQIQKMKSESRKGDSFIEQNIYVHMQLVKNTIAALIVTQQHCVMGNELNLCVFVDDLLSTHNK